MTQKLRQLFDLSSVNHCDTSTPNFFLKCIKHSRVKSAFKLRPKYRTQKLQHRPNGGVGFSFMFLVGGDPVATKWNDELLHNMSTTKKNKDVNNEANLQCTLKLKFSKLNYTLHSRSVQYVFLGDQNVIRSDTTQVISEDDCTNVRNKHYRKICTLPI